METESGNVQENRYDVENLRFELLENGQRTGFVYHNGELLHEEGEIGQDLSGQLSTGLITGRDGKVLNGYLYDAFGAKIETKRREVCCLLLIQSICLGWGKDERSAVYAKKRAGFPMAYPMDKFDQFICPLECRGL